MIESESIEFTETISMDLKDSLPVLNSARKQTTKKIKKGTSQLRVHNLKELAARQGVPLSRLASLFLLTRRVKWLITAETP